MDEASFWRLIVDTRAAAGNDTGRQSKLLEERLVGCRRSRSPSSSESATGSTSRRTHGTSGEPLTSSRTAAPTTASATFAYLISLGRGPYEGALQGPDSLAPVVQDAEEGDWENADNVAPDAYQSATGEDIPTEDSDLSGSPRGEPWDDEDQEALVQRYPGLAARFR